MHYTHHLINCILIFSKEKKKRRKSKKRGNGGKNAKKKILKYNRVYWSEPMGDMFNS
jgi:hypothetical protein